MTTLHTHGGTDAPECTTCSDRAGTDLLAGLHAQSALDDAARLAEQLGRETT